ncbi:adhesion G protein-coupled receptor E5-like [Pholidichthys leucotaenia]
MTARRILLIVAICLCVVVVSVESCPQGFAKQKNGSCEDDNECEEDRCPSNANCMNTYGSFYCQCNDGFLSPEKTVNVSPFSQCEVFSSEIDVDECQEENRCGKNASCTNTKGSYECTCHSGFGTRSGKFSFSTKEEQCEDLCMINETICGNGTCNQGPSGHYCVCRPGFTNYGNKKAPCTVLSYDILNDMHYVKKEFPVVGDLVKQLKKNCFNLRESENSCDGENILKKLQSIIDELLSHGVISDNKKISIFLALVKNMLKFMGPFVKTSGIKRSSGYTEVEMFVHNGPVIPQGSRTLSSKNAKLDIQMETAAGDPRDYPGFTAVSMMTYSNLEESADGFFDGIKTMKNQSLRINSKVVTVVVSNRNTSHLKEPVKLTIYHLKKSNQTTCVFWDSSVKSGTWSGRGCSVVESNLEYTVCSCNHLSSFAVLMALHEVEDRFELHLITWLGLSLSLICLFICILTFSMIRSIQSPRTTIHLHLCISLFVANFIFLVGISQTKNKVGCAVVAGVLHFSYLAAFCWMCLEGIQLFRMVVLVFNTNFKTLYMMAGGYGVPAVIVAVSALANPKGYGTERYCWLNLELIWSFFGPACAIIFINIFFFLITVWKLAQKFSSLNPDLDNLQKIKAFTITAVAQLCILGIMWIFGCFQFEGSSLAMSYLFTIFGSLQGVLLFIMHCLFSKQVREEYENILSRCCAPQKKSYKEFNYSNSSKARESKSTQDTGESRT